MPFFVCGRSLYIHRKFDEVMTEIKMQFFETGCRLALVVVVAGECPTPCKKGGGIARAGEMFGGYVRVGNVQDVCVRGVPVGILP